MRWLGTLQVTLMTAVLSGCAVNTPSPPVPVETVELTEPEEPVVEPRETLLAYYGRLRTSSQEVWVEERRRLESNADSEDDFTLALRQGLLLLASGVLNGQREANVLAQLAPEYASQQSEGRRALAALISTQIRLRRQVLTASEQPASEANVELDRLRAENARLQEQINALTNIEQQLIERELQEAQQNRQP